MLWSFEYFVLISVGGLDSFRVKGISYWELDRVFVLGGLYCFRVNILWWSRRGG